mmetsp:Transcript_20523/g.29300  ORF Transcript_20523/g.29300 Transcript_20523/m.29300 type:complete len:370 (-) Transcript_20523:189-1298(-)|eukprot:CAMPEP_0172433354 /NCGR_PEP_ID=MMETSP1064-20121228/67820_1 /TAXON_ID=202472 /ORGANISM="Aulacoseira subarctica , Strain CCAP 1002/5" /LENGTH=369 /DNA_ID=CAMNT_0013181241 /DNA_START=26 /DNA_END=1135 /DNA_ORIENTATION=-
MSTNSELYNLCHYLSEYERTEEAWKALEQWLNFNKDDIVTFRAAAMYQDGYSSNSCLYMLMTVPGVSLDMVQIFIKNAPELLRMKNVHGHIPLTMACDWGAPLEVVKALVDAYPEGVRNACQMGSFPCHDACVVLAERADHIKMLQSLSVLNVLLENFPESIDLEFQNQTLPQFLRRVSLNEDFKIDKDHVYLMQRQAFRGAFFGEFSALLLKLVLQAFPECCALVDDDGMTLLHIACENMSGKAKEIEIIMDLLDASPKSSSIIDALGRTPSQLLKVAASRKDENGMFLLHRQAASVNGSLTVNFLNLLFTAYPEIIAERDNYGMLPLHHACINNKVFSLDVLILFLQLYPESVCQKIETSTGQSQMF